MAVMGREMGTHGLFRGRMSHVTRAGAGSCVHGGATLIPPPSLQVRWSARLKNRSQG